MDVCFQIIVWTITVIGGQRLEEARMLLCWWLENQTLLAQTGFSIFPITEPGMAKLIDQRQGWEGMHIN